MRFAPSKGERRRMDEYDWHDIYYSTKEDDDVEEEVLDITQETEEDPELVEEEVHPKHSISRCFACLNEIIVKHPVIAAIVVAALLAVLGYGVSIPIKNAREDDNPVRLLENITWTAVTVLNGTDTYDYFGESVDLTSNGQAVAIGGRHIDGREGPYVQVYRFDEKGQELVLLGEQISSPEPEEGPETQFDVSLSDDGEVLLLFSGGRAHLFRLDEGEWKLHVTFDASKVMPDGQVGSLFSARLSGNGRYVALGAIDSRDANMYTIQVFDVDRIFPRKNGRPLTGTEMFRGRLPHMAIASMGETIVIGGGGVAVVYRLGQLDWLQGVRLSGGDMATALFGSAVAVSDDGGIVAVGDEGSNGFAGSVTVFEYKKGTWKQLGGTIEGEPGEFWLGPLALSGNGVVAAFPIIIPFTELDRSWGALRAYYYNPVRNSWVQIDSIGSSDFHPYSCAFSYDGTSLCCGEYLWRYKGNSTNYKFEHGLPGSVRVDRLEQE